MMLDALCRPRLFAGLLVLAGWVAAACLAHGDDVACEPPPGSVGAKEQEAANAAWLAAHKKTRVLAASQEPKRKADPGSDVVIHLLPAPPPPQPTPPAPGSPLSLPAGKLLLVTSATVELFPKWIARDGSEVSIKSLKGPVVIYGEFVDPQPSDEDGRSIADPYIYIIRAKTVGKGTLVVVPSGAKAASGIASQPIDVGDPVPPNPVIVTISPTSATVQTGGKQQFAATASQGGVTWKASGAGTVDASGLFTAATSSGTAQVVAISSINSSITATATVTVTGEPPPNPLTAALQAAYTAETFAGKAAGLAWLTAVYKGVAGTGAGSANDPNLKTYGDLFATVKAAVEAKVPAGTLPLLAKVIGDDVNAALKPTTQGAIDRVKATAEFKKISDALAGVKP